jgi:hypothetical protein
MAGILKNLQCHPSKIGGADDHVHILSSLSKNIAFADTIGRVKGSPMHLGVIPFCSAIPPKNGQSRSLSSGFNIGALSLVLKIQ